MVSFKLRPLYCRGKSPRYPLDRRLGGPQSRSGRCGEDKNLLRLPRNEPRPELYGEKETVLSLGLPAPTLPSYPGSYFFRHACTISLLRDDVVFIQ
jgi:hypothetical protein